MRALHLQLSLASIAVVYSTSTYQTLAQIRAATPECARKCSAPTISGLICNITSVRELASCLCPNTAARRKISACVQESCSYQDVLLASMPSREYCAPYPVPSRSHEIRITTIVLLALTIPFLLGRLWVRMVIVRELWWDDYTLALVAVFMIAYFCINFPMVDLGLGKHGWDVNPNDAAALTKMYFFAQISYAGVQNVTKISILLCFLRIFPQRWFRISVYFSLVWVSIRCIAYFCLIGIRCLPLRATYDHSVHGKCLSLNMIAYVGAAFSIAEDIWILILPIPLLSSLKVAQGRKLALMAMFSVGILACVTSMIRLKHMADFGSSVDSTWDNTSGSIWSLVENGIAVICACLPALRPLLSRLLPRFFGFTDSHSSRKGEKLIDDPEALMTIGRKRASKSVDMFGMRASELQDTRRSAASIELEGREDKMEIVKETVVTTKSEVGEVPVKGEVRGI